MAKKSKKAETVSSAPETNDDWEINNTVENLVRAHEIIGDPKKMKAVIASLDKKRKSIKSIDDVKKYLNEHYGAGSISKVMDDADGDE